jgi:hypothetical protein
VLFYLKRSQVVCAVELQEQHPCFPCTILFGRNTGGLLEGHLHSGGLQAFQEDYMTPYSGN